MPRPASSCINFNGAFFDGYLLVRRLSVSRLGPTTANRSSTCRPRRPTIFIAGEDGDDDIITGGSGNDLIFGGGGNDDLVGGLGDDLWSAARATTISTPGSTATGDDYLQAPSAPTPWSAAQATTPTASTICSTSWSRPQRGHRHGRNLHGRALDREHGQRREPHLRGVDADQFVGTGNGGNNVITGGDLADTLSGLGWQRHAQRRARRRHPERRRRQRRSYGVERSADGGSVET